MRFSSFTYLVGQGLHLSLIHISSTRQTGLPKLWFLFLQRLTAQAPALPAPFPALC